MKARLKKSKRPEYPFHMVVLYRGGSADPDLSAADLHHAEPVVSTIQDAGSKLSLPAMWNFQNYIDVFKSGDPLDGLLRIPLPSLWKLSFWKSFFPRLQLTVLREATVKLQNPSEISTWAS